MLSLMTWYKLMYLLNYYLWFDLTCFLTDFMESLLNKYMIRSKDIIRNMP